MQKELSAELGPEFGDLKLQDLNPHDLVRRHLLEDSDSSDVPSSGQPQTLALGEAPPVIQMPPEEPGHARLQEGEGRDRGLIGGWDDQDRRGPRSSAAFVQ